MTLIHGIVTTKSGVPLPGTPVTIDYNYISFSNSEGYFSIDVIKDNNIHTITIQHDGYSKYSNQIYFTDPPTYLNIQLQQVGVFSSTGVNTAGAKSIKYQIELPMIKNNIVTGISSSSTKITLYVNDYNIQSEIPDIIGGISIDKKKIGIIKPMDVISIPIQIQPEHNPSGGYDACKKCFYDNTCSTCYSPAVNNTPPFYCGHSIIVSGIGENAGTLGCIVKDNTTGKYMILSNNHVIATNFNGVTNRPSGTDIKIPGTLEKKWVVWTDTPQPHDLNKCVHAPYSPYLAKLSRWSTIKTSTENKTDSAVAEILDIYKFSADIYNIGKISGYRPYAQTESINTLCKYSGRTSGLVNGIVIDDEFTTKVSGYSDGNDYIFSDQYLIFIPVSPTSISGFGCAGDSGSVVVNDANEAFALIFAGDSTVNSYTDDLGNVQYGTIMIANKLQNIFSELNVSLVTELPITPATKPARVLLRAYNASTNKRIRSAILNTITNSAGKTVTVNKPVDKTVFKLRPGYYTFTITRIGFKPITIKYSIPYSKKYIFNIYMSRQITNN